MKPCEKCEGTVETAKARLIFLIFTLESLEPHPRYCDYPLKNKVVWLEKWFRG